MEFFRKLYSASIQKMFIMNTLDGSGPPPNRPETEILDHGYLICALTNKEESTFELIDFETSNKISSLR